ncbi:DUF4397 domain-containing protein [Actinomadura rudentiformis]|uniref:DUF4397 domain-containing protein n=1 Tax=Actinomadura rudentiformis TaxID=359158 RepID=A0A6H9Y704_9ACTN|nr:DUF4397 domain-containing protein [Actinomadura rudentiformis]KAB2339505.1 DUF4397 domain-containing protein [Actinomadura rudentiformis]
MLALAPPYSSGGRPGRAGCSIRFARVGAVAVLTAAAAGIGAVPGAAASDGAAPAQGYVRLAHLSPDTPAVDVYLYAGKGSLNRKNQRLVLKHVGYGALSPYQRLDGGTYTVAMRPANAAATSPPVLSAVVRVRGGGAYTVAGMGPYKGIKLQVVNDSVDLPAGRAAVRVIAASLKVPTVDVSLGERKLASGLEFASVAPYEIVPARTARVRVEGEGGEEAGAKVALGAGSVHTVVVLDGKPGLRVVSLVDVAQGSRTPTGGVNAGFGGLAGHVAEPADEEDRGVWTVVALAVMACAGMGTMVLVRSRRRA